jgi:tetratricopeptide (TPR) repeat protein
MKPDNLSADRLEAFLEYARCEAAGGKTLAAFKMLDYASRNASGLSAVAVRMAYADVAVIAADYEKAVQWLREAIERGDQWATGGARTESSKQEFQSRLAQWNPLSAFLEQRLRNLEFKAAEDQWGQGYAWYLFAQKSRRADHPLARDFTDSSALYPGKGAGRAKVPGADFEDALWLYTQLIENEPETVFAEAARLYSAVCMIHLGRTDDAEKALDRFIKSSALGLYRGEAFLTLGDLYFQAQWDPDQARRQYETGLSWCRQAAAVKQGSRFYAVPERAREPSRAPDVWQSMNEGGVIEPETVPPGAVVNRRTADWYLDWLQSEFLYRLGFLDALEGEWNRARSQWVKITNHDGLLEQAQARRYFNALRRLEGAAKKGYFVGHEEDNERINSRVKNALWWADFLHMRERFVAAESLYRRLYTAAVARHDGPVAARAGLGVMLRYYGDAHATEMQMHRHYARARSLGEDILAKFSRAPAAAYVAYMVASCWDTIKDPDYSDAISAYRRVYRNYPESRHAKFARFYELVCAINVAPKSELGKFDNAIRRFERDFPNRKEWAEMLRWTLTNTAGYGRDDDTEQSIN